MTGFLGAFANRFGKPRPEREEILRVKALARDALVLPEDAALTVSEIVCADPACPGIETVILVMIPGARTRALKLQKPVEEVGADDLRAAAEAG